MTQTEILQNENYRLRRTTRVPDPLAFGRRFPGMAGGEPFGRVGQAFELGGAPFWVWYFKGEMGEMRTDGKFPS